MNHANNKAKQFLTLAISFTTLGLFMLPGIANAVAAPGATASTTQTTMQQQHLAAIKTKGDQEITRRLDQLNKLSGLITGAKHLKAADQTALTSEVAGEIMGLTALKTKLDGETTLDAAVVDAKSIFTDYRVYALVTPKVWLIRVADDQLTVEDKLSALASKLKDRLATAKSSSKDVTSLQTALDDMNLQIKNAQTISTSIETKVLTLLPSDYNTDHTILTGDHTQLKTAHTDNEAAYTDAKTITAGLKNL